MSLQKEVEPIKSTRDINKVPLETLQKLLNHSSSAITLRYIGITQNVLIDCYNAVNL